MQLHKKEGSPKAVSFVVDPAEVVGVKLLCLP